MKLKKARQGSRLAKKAGVDIDEVRHKLRTANNYNLMVGESAFKTNFFLEFYSGNSQRKFA